MLLSSITIAFRFINFALFLILLMYGFKRYIYDVLLAQMAMRDKAHKDLEQQKELLSTMQANLDEQMHTNEQMHKELMITLHIWQSSFERKQQELQEEKERIRYQLELKMKRRCEIQLLNLAQDEVVLPAVANSSKALHDYFSQKKHGHAYIQEVLAFMESRL